MEDRKPVYSEFEVAILNRLQTMEGTMGGIHESLSDLAEFAKDMGKRMVSIEVECKHHREKTDQLVAEIKEANGRIDQHDKVVEQVSGGWKATSALAAVITVLVNALEFVIHRLVTGKN